MDTKQKNTKNNVALIGGETTMHIEFDVPISIIIKEKSRNTDSLFPYTTYGWKTEYHGLIFGDYMSFTDDIIHPAVAKELYEITMSQAKDTFIHRVLLVDAPVESLISELEYRLKKKYYPVHSTTGSKYMLEDEVENRIYRSQYSLRYLSMKIKTFVTCGLLKLVSKFL